MMSEHRATKSGFAAEAQAKVEAAYNEQEALKCLQWIQAVLGCDEIPSDPSQIDASKETFQKILGDGMILCKLIDKLMDSSAINWKEKTFQPCGIPAMRTMRERERIAMFNKLVQEFGVDNTSTFPTESLHEIGALNLAQVCSCIRAVGIEAQNKPGYSGPEGVWPKKAAKQHKEWTEEQLKAGDSIISLQMGSNKGASQAGMSIGKSRHIID